MRPAGLDRDFPKLDPIGSFPPTGTADTPAPTGAAVLTARGDDLLRRAAALRDQPL